MITALGGFVLGLSLGLLRAMLVRHGLEDERDALKRKVRYLQARLRESGIYSYEGRPVRTPK